MNTDLNERLSNIKETIIMLQKNKKSNLFLQYKDE